MFGIKTKDLDIAGEILYSLDMAKPIPNPNPKPIRILESSVIDRIAAGEVVDRPAHMIKELCENSLDAGATELSVDFKNGGRDVVIRDNGSGIRAPELPLALARHGTSKILTADDLWQVSSYGFRGEALASIGAVSCFTITSRPNGQEFGAKITNNFGDVGPVTETGADFGTTIEVRDLFQNVPARLKFLKTESGESAAIKHQLKALALANPQVSLRVLQDNKLIYFWPKSANIKDRVEQILEKGPLYAGEAILDGFCSQVIISDPNETVGNARQIWLFVRGRYIQDRGLQTAVTEAYRNLLMHGEYPTAAIFLDCPSDQLDVNVSPTKSQVKFRDSSVAFRVVQRAVRGVLESAPWLAPLLGHSTPTVESNSFSKNLNNEASSPISYSTQHSLSFQTNEFARTQYKVKDSSPSFSLSEVKKSLNSIASDSGVTERGVTGRMVAANWSSLEVIGQAHLTYILAQKEEAILFIDQHAAHERILFEKLMSDYKNGHIEVQNFLLQPVVKLPEDIVNAILRFKNELEKLGLYVDAIGPAELSVQGAPAVIKPESIAVIIEKLGQEYAEHGGSFHLDKTIAELVATMACHSAVRAGQALSQIEMQSLLKQMDDYPLSSFCPHGRPVYVEYPIRKLERDFGRIT